MHRPWSDGSDQRPVDTHPAPDPARQTGQAAREVDVRGVLIPSHTRCEAAASGNGLLANCCPKAPSRILPGRGVMTAPGNGSLAPCGCRLASSQRGSRPTLRSAWADGQAVKRNEVGGERCHNGDQAMSWTETACPPRLAGTAPGSGGLDRQRSGSTAFPAATVCLRISSICGTKRT